MADARSPLPPQPVPSEPDAERRLAELATGFALGELTLPELEELYGRLRIGGDAGQQAAQIVWQTLSASMDLRATLSDHFPATVAHRVREAECSGFAQAIAGQIGIGGADLPEGANAAKPPRRRGWRWLIPLAVLLVAGALAGWWWVYLSAKRMPQVRQISVVGAVAGLDENQRVVADRPVTVAAASSLSLDWPGGGSVRIVGPAEFRTHADGITLREGHLHARTAGVFQLYLPDGRAQAEGAAAFSAEVAQGRSMLGVREGSLSVHAAGAGAQWYVLRPEQAGMPGGEPFAWLREPMLPEQVAAGGVRVLPVLFPSGTPGWRIRARIVWDSDEGAAVFRHAPQLPGQPAGFLRILPRRAVRPAAEGDEELSLPGAALAAREFEACVLPGGKAYLMVSGLPQPLEFPAGSALSQIETTGGARVEVLSAHNGPEPDR